MHAGSTEAAGPQSDGDIAMKQWWFFAIFAASGFAALIYESLWSRYLKIFLGHAAYAQALVLTIFLLGMALGAGWTARRSERLQRPLLYYAAIELLLALMALLFHPLFVFVQDRVLYDILPVLQQDVLAELFKWTAGAALIFVQSLLLGATFPLLSAGMLRLWRRDRGEIIAMLYFTNSLGAVVGVFTGGFILLPLLGLPGTALIGVIVNAAVALAVWLLVRRHAERAPPVVAVQRPEQGGILSLQWLLMTVAAVTGMASFIYEMLWIRMISVLLGGSTYSFEMMLGIFILGLALGSWLIRRYIGRITDPLSVLGGVQVAMGVLAMLSLLMYAFLFEEYLRHYPYPRGFWNYVLHLAISTLWVSWLLLPVTICAGMTLPLITKKLMDERGEASLGIVYAANTLGAIAGVLLTVHLLLPSLGVKNAMLVGAGADIALGLGLLMFAGKRSMLAVAVVAVGLGLGLAQYFGEVPLRHAAAGSYRHGMGLDEDARVIFYRDGKTASIAVTEHPRKDSAMHYAIRTNGKVDAGLLYDPEDPKRQSSDEKTMVIAGVLPLVVRPDARLAANIGFGSGLTTRILLQSSTLQRVDNIEIEPMMVLGARHLGAKVAPVFEDERNHLIVDDAKSVFARSRERYPIIVSEPSNPWISGVAGLFTREFYRRVKRALAQDGVFIQWLPMYESSSDIVASVMKALAAEFSDFQLYLTGNDLIILGVATGRVPPLRPDIFAAPDTRELLDIYGFGSEEDVARLYVGDKKHLMAYFSSVDAPVNSDYFPYLEHRAPLAFFQRSKYELPKIMELPLPLVEMAFGTPRFTPREGPSPLDPDAEKLVQSLSGCRHRGEALVTDIRDLMRLLLPGTGTSDMRRIWQRFADADCMEEASAGPEIGFWRALSLRDAAGVVGPAEELLASANLKTRDGQLLLLGAMLAHRKLGNRERLLELLNMVPQASPVIWHAARMIAAPIEGS